jgi:hypothetical protein
VAPTAKVFIGHAAAITGPTLWINNMADPTTSWDTTIRRPAYGSGFTALTWAPVPIRGNNRSSWTVFAMLVATSLHGGGYTVIGDVLPGGEPLHASRRDHVHARAGNRADDDRRARPVRLRLIFDNSSPSAATTTGNGNGGLPMALGGLAPGIVEGYTLLSSTTTGAQGAGPLFGIYPDLLTFSGALNTPAGYGDPLHWIASPAIPGIWPAAPFQLPPGNFSFLAGQTRDCRRRVRSELQPGPDELRVAHPLVT